MNFGLDYLSAHLDLKTYNFQAFEHEASSPVFNRETGDILNSMIPKSCYRADVHGTDVVIGTYKGGQFGFAQIVEREGLKVTRVDIKCDFLPREVLNDECTPNQYTALLVRKIKNYFLKEGRRVQCHSDTTLSVNPDEPKSYVFGARGSEYQIRIYSRNSDTGQLVRIEFQLRKDLARSVWEAIRENVYDENLIAKAFFSIEATLLTPGLIGIGYTESLLQLKGEKEVEVSDRQRWFETQVFQAAVNHFRETGVDLTYLLHQRFLKHFKVIMDDNIEYNQLSERAAKAERLFSE